MPSSDESGKHTVNGSLNSPLAERLIVLKSKRAQQWQLGLTLLFFILGVSNIWFGSHKLNQYGSLLDKAVSQFEPAPSRKMPLPLLDPEAPKEGKQLERIRSRMDYYSFVVMGGKLFLVVAGFMLLVTLISTRPDDDSQ